MKKSELIQKISTQINVNKQQVKIILNSMVDVIITELKKGNKVSITGFGAFSAKVRRARFGVNPQNPSQKIKMPAIKVAKFKTGNLLKNSLKNSK